MLCLGMLNVLRVVILDVTIDQCIYTKWHYADAECHLSSFTAAGEPL